MRSLTLRLALLTALWAAAGLALTFVFVARLAEAQIQNAADARLSALLDAVVAAAGTDAEGRPLLLRPVSEPEFNRPLSGTYWQIISPAGSARSRSLWDAVLPRAAPAGGTVLAQDVVGPRRETLRMLARQVVLPESASPLIVQVAADQADTMAEIARFRRSLGLAFVLLGGGLVLGSLPVIWHGLAPLRAARHALAEMREGRRERLDLPAPREIAPLVAEIDALLGQNRATVERARTHVGNLAHALKTPVAVALNALERDPPQPVEALAAAREMQRVVQHHLARARAAALPAIGGGAASPLAAVEEVAMALRRLRAESGIIITTHGDPALRVRSGRQDVVEMVGNLMENACTHARRQVAVTVLAAQDAAGRAVARLLVEDDGPGLPATTGTERAVARGVRLDEAAPGSGLGLAIVADLASLHGGRLALERSEALGGTLAALDLPAFRAGHSGSRA